MQKSCKENEGKPKCNVPKRQEEHYGEFQRQQTEGNFRQRLLQSLEEFKEDIDHFKDEEMTREGDEMERHLEEIRGLRKKCRALLSNRRHSQDHPYPI
ncbi:LOW QUALITY PROTEIN: transcription elongation factor A protein-like 7 [Dama dama]